jgi:retron-type reverse transcriptase
MDWKLVRARWNLVRYADDFVICCASRSEAEQAHAATAQVLAELRLRLEPAKTRITSFADGFEFLGVYFEGGEYRFTWQDKRIAVTGAAPEWLWSYAPQGYG